MILIQEGSSFECLMILFQEGTSFLVFFMVSYVLGFLGLIVLGSGTTDNNTCHKLLNQSTLGTGEIWNLIVFCDLESIA